MNVKNGFLTSEFWISLLVQIVSIAALTGYISPEDADKWQRAAVQIGGLIAMVVSAAFYNKSREKVKVSNAQAQAAEECIETGTVTVDPTMGPAANKLMADAQRRAQAKRNREELKRKLAESPPGSITVEDGKEYREK